MSQEAAKWAREKAKQLWRECCDCTNGEVSHAVRENCTGPNWDRETKHMETALLEADKNGYERGREEGNGGCCDCVRKYEAAQKDDEALLREAFTRLEDFHPPTCEIDRKLCGTCEFLGKLKDRLAPSVGLSEGKKKT